MTTLPKFNAAFNSKYDPAVLNALKSDLKSAGSSALAMNKDGALQVVNRTAAPVTKEENAKVVGNLLEKLRLGLDKDLPRNFLWNLSGKMFGDVDKGKYLSGKRAAKFIDDSLKAYDKSKRVESQLNNLRWENPVDILEKYGSKALFRSFPRELLNTSEIREQVEGAIRGAGNGNPTSFPTQELKRSMSKILGKLHCSVMEGKMVAHYTKRAGLDEDQARALGAILRDHSKALLSRLGIRRQAVNPEKLFRSFSRLSVEASAKFYTENRDVLVNTVKTPEARKMVEDAMGALKKDVRFRFNDEDWDALTDAAAKKIKGKLIANGYTGLAAPGLAQIFTGGNSLGAKKLPGEDWVLKQLMDFAAEKTS